MMELGFSAFVIGLVSIAVTGFVGWTIVSIIHFKSEISTVRLEMAQNYAPNSDLAKFEHNLEKLSDKVDAMLSLLYQIRSQVNVTTPTG